MDIKSNMIDTDLADLREATLDELLQRSLRDALVPFRDVLVSQVERPRINIGTGPPSHAD